jgi:hypothetical protein
MGIILRYVYVTEQDSARHDAASKARSMILANASKRSSANASSSAQPPGASATSVSVEDGCLEDDDEEEEDDNQDDILDAFEEDEEDDPLGKTDETLPEDQAETGQAVAPISSTISSSANARRSSTPHLSSKQQWELKRQKFLDRTKRTRQNASPVLCSFLLLDLLFLHRGPTLL